MPTIFDNWTVQDAIEKIPNRNDSWLQANLAFYDGDHWQKGDAWTGPMLPSSHAQYTTALTNVEKGFVSKNVIAEVVDRHIAGILGRSPNWTPAVRRPLEQDEEPNKEEQDLIKEAQAALTEWLDGQYGIAPRERGQNEIKLCTPFEVAQLAVGSALLTRRGVFRLFVTPAAVIPNEQNQLTVEQDPLAESIKKIFVQHTESSQAGVVIDKDTMDKVGIYSYKQDDGLEFVELSYLDSENTLLRITNRRTTLRGGQPKRGQKNLSEQTTSLPLGGRLTIYEMERSLLIGESVRQAQKALNKAKTMNSRNLDSGGFLERIFLNAQMPGAWEDDPDNPGKKMFVPANIYLGPGTASWLSGIETTDSEGRKALASPSVVYRDPVPSTTFIESGTDYYRGILEETDQLHVLISGDATASGESRLQAKDDFLKSLLITKDELDAALTWLLETVLKMAAYFAATPDRFDGLRIVVDSQVDLGIIGSDEQQQVISAVDGELLSQETGMRRIKVQDPAAEKALIQTEAAGSLSGLKQRADIIKTLADAGVDFRTGGEIAGLDSNQLALLKKAQEKKEQMAKEMQDQTQPPGKVLPANGKEPVTQPDNEG